VCARIGKASAAMRGHSARPGQSTRASAGGVRFLPYLQGLFGLSQKVTARGMARAVTDTTFGGKGGDRPVAGGTISYGVDISVGVPDQQDRSKRIRCRVHWGPIRNFSRFWRNVWHFDLSPMPRIDDRTPKLGRRRVVSCSLFQAGAAGALAARVRYRCLGYPSASSTSRCVMPADWLHDWHRATTRKLARGEQRFRAYLW
jgi:hypothetical protein